ncbi:MAG: hypothetical protein HY664_00590 [Chloroflexi bacterium]|nr:hypothetical protein [Chloroflexota bacterium]
MTFYQWLLTALGIPSIVAVIGFIIALLGHRRQAEWRQGDLLRGSGIIRRWSEGMVVFTEVEANRPKEHWRPAVEEDDHFASDFKLAPKKVQRQYKKFRKALVAYIEACNALYSQIEQECTEKTGLPLGKWGEGKSWPPQVLLPNFGIPIYEQVLGTRRRPQLESASYRIRPFSIGSGARERKGFRLAITHYDASNGRPDLAVADDRITLEQIQSIHRQMMEMDYCEKFVVEVDQVRDLKRKAEELAQKVREDLRKLELS